MDLKMSAENVTAGKHPVWDVKVDSVPKGDGKADFSVPIVYGETELSQRANLSGFLQTGSVPQLPDAGVPWQQYLTNKITFGELDAWIRQSLIQAGAVTYYPRYELSKDGLRLTVDRRNAGVAGYR